MGISRPGLALTPAGSHALPNGPDQWLATTGLSTPPGFIASPLHRVVSGPSALLGYRILRPAAETSSDESPEKGEESLNQKHALPFHRPERLGRAGMTQLMQRLLQNNIDRPTPQPIIALLDPHHVCKRQIEALRQTSSAAPTRAYCARGSNTRANGRTRVALISSTRGIAGRLHSPRGCCLGMIH